jgi:signal transduction histidine kinase
MKLARLIHADIDVQSELNKGSTFIVYIPDLGE